MTFADQLKRDAIRLCSKRYWGEDIVYYLGGDVEADGRALEAIIDREPEVPSATEYNQPVKEYELSIPHDKTQGVLASELSPGHDLVDLVDEVGVLRRCTVTSVRSSDAGMIRLILRVGPEVEDEEEGEE